MYPSKDSIEIVNSFLNNPHLQKLVVDELGPLVSPIKILWESDSIYFYGSRGTKKLAISDILSAATNGILLS